MAAGNEVSRSYEGPDDRVDCVTCFGTGTLLYTAAQRDEDCPRCGGTGEDPTPTAPHAEA